MPEAPISVDPHRQEEIMCPRCGRFVGPLNKCPHCGAAMGKRLSLRLFRWIAVFLATVGLALLYAMALHRDIPLIKIGDLKPTMNFAYIRVAGHVIGETRVFRENDSVRSLRFTVEDESGEMDVVAYRQQAQEVVSHDLVPRMGDSVEVAGSLGLAAEQGAILRLQSFNQLKLERAAPKAMKLADITMDHARGFVEVTGKIVSVDAPNKGSRQPWNIMISDGDIRRPLVFWQDVYDAIPDKDKLVKGADVRAVVRIGTYMNRMQLSVITPQDLHVLAEGSVPSPAESAPKEPSKPKTPAPEPVAHITTDMTGKVVTVSGRINDPRPVKGGTVLTVADDSASIDVILWTNKFSPELVTNFAVGAQLTVSGRVRQYEDHLEIIPGRTTDVIVTARAP